MKSLITSLFCLISICLNAGPIDDLAYRVTNGTSSGKIFFELGEENGNDWFSITAPTDSTILIVGNNTISQAVGLGWYLKHTAHIHICWNNPSQSLPVKIPLPEQTVFRKTTLKNRYYLNYCTHSYSMAFWDKKRWMQEIDWMALHGVTMPLCLTGTEAVWRNIMLKIGYTDDEVAAFVPGPAYMAWWHMNNLEGWGGPLPAEWYDRVSEIQSSILERMQQFGMQPVLPGFSGMAPHDIGLRFGEEVADPGRWCSFRRPAFVYPGTPLFDKLSKIYYDELTKLYGTSCYYAADPFHEGGAVGDTDLEAAAKAILKGMKSVNPDAKWVIQSWQQNPLPQITEAVDSGDMLILDLYSDKRPKWENNAAYRKHNWLLCMLLNFGGNTGMHGRIEFLTEQFKNARNSATLKGVGATPEGIENNPVMYEYLYELPWLEDDIDPKQWLGEYITARYGVPPTQDETRAWEILYNTVYNAPVDYKGEGTVESLICARPSLKPRSASTWGNAALFYSPDSTAVAAELLSRSAQRHKDCINYNYDLVDLKRQSIADKVNLLLDTIKRSYEDNRVEFAKSKASEFLKLLLEQDSQLEDMPGANSSIYIDNAESCAGDNSDFRKICRKNAAQLITVWGDSTASNAGGLHDYSHREWHGIIRELYYKRWKAFFEHIFENAPQPNYYKMELEWVDSVQSPSVRKFSTAFEGAAPSIISLLNVNDAASASVLTLKSAGPLAFRRRETAASTSSGSSTVSA